MDFEINPVYNPVFHRICKRIAEEWVNSDEEPSEDSDSETECQGSDGQRLIFSDEEDQKFREAVLQKSLPSFDGDFDLAADYSDLDTFGAQDFGDPLPTHRSKKSKRPSKVNRAKPAEEVDDCRPSSERNRFSLLKESKKKVQLAPVNVISPKEYYHKMVKKNKNKPTAGSDSENNNPTEQRNSRSTKNQTNDAQVDKNASASAKGYVITNAQMLQMTPEKQERFIEMYLDGLDKDKKLGQDKRLEAIARMREKMLVLLFTNQTLRKKADKLAENCAELQQDIQKLQLNLEREKKKVDHRSIKAKSMVMKENKEELKRIKDTVTEELWRTCKFIQCADDEEIACKFVYEKIYGDPMEDPAELGKMYSWIETYKAWIKKSLYDKRNYITSQMKSAAMDLLDNEKELPTIEMVVKCLERSIDLKDPEENALFQWYWEVLLAKMMGSSDWGPSVRYYNTICGAKLKRDPKKGIVTSSHEGMLAAIWDNNRDNWISLFNWSQDPKNKGKIQPNEGGKFTSTKKGQRAFGGWEPEGLEAYNAYYEKNVAARKLEKRKEVEKAMYDQLRTAMGIIAPEHTTHVKGIREKKRKKLPKDQPYVPPTKRIVRMKILDDDGEEVLSDGE
jgi:hypothetical protein